MKKLLLALLVGTLLGGCGGGNEIAEKEVLEDANQEVVAPDLDDPKVREKILAVAVEWVDLEWSGGLGDGKKFVHFSWILNK